MITADIVLVPVMIFSLSILFLLLGVGSFLRGVAINKRYQHFARLPGKLKPVASGASMGAVIEVAWHGQVYADTAPHIYSIKEEDVTVLFDTSYHVGRMELDNWTRNGKVWKIVSGILFAVALTTASIMSLLYFDISM